MLAQCPPLVLLEFSWIRSASTRADFLNDSKCSADRRSNFNVPTARELSLSNNRSRDELRLQAELR